MTVNYSLSDIFFSIYNYNRDRVLISQPSLKKGGGGGLISNTSTQRPTDVDVNHTRKSKKNRTMHRAIVKLVS